MKKILLPLIILMSTLVIGQEKLSFIDIEALQKQAGESIREGDFAKTLELLEKIPANDSVYCSSLVSRTYYLLQLDRNEEVIALSNAGLEDDCEDSDLYFYINRGVAYESLEQYDLAIKTYDEALVKHSKYAQLWYNKGVVLEKMGEINQAITHYQQAILLNPLYASPHLRLGNICYTQNKLAQAMMAINMYLILDIEGTSALAVLVGLNEKVSVKNPNTPDPELQISEDEQSFEMIDLILDNRIALNANYETGNKIKFPVINQNHALLDQLKSYEGETGFWAETYVPFYKWVEANGHFNNFAYTLFNSTTNADYQKIINSEKENIISFVEKAYSKWAEILSNSTFRIPEEEEGMYYNYSNNYLEAVGKMENNVVSGSWSFYTNKGAFSAKGQFDIKGKRDGNWIWYYPDGTVKETATFKNGLVEGKNTFNFPNGKPNYVAQFKNDELDGEYLLYNEKGALFHKKHFKNGKLDGVFNSYFDVGEAIPEFYVEYKNGELDGVVREYYSNGTIYNEYSARNGSKEGLEKSYYLTGNLYSEYNYVDGELQGPYKRYHENGQLMETGTYVSGSIEGPVKLFYSDGTPEEELVYEKGKVQGIYKTFARDGKLHLEYEYNKGEIIAYTFYDKSGNKIGEGRKRRGAFYFKGFNPYGQIFSEGRYNVSGGKTGNWKYYTDNGVLLSSANYNEDVLEGEYVDYYLNGDKKMISNYNNGAVEGYYADYHPNGKMSTQGWYKNDTRQGVWHTYYLDGTQESILYYHKNQLNGLQHYFSRSGKPVSHSMFKFGDPLYQEHFDINGTMYSREEYTPQKNTYTVSNAYVNGNPNYETTYVNGVKHGAYTIYTFNGKKRLSGNYLNGKKHGTWTWFYENGQPETVINYLLDELQGEYISYYENGQAELRYYYNLGKKTGTWYTYHENGNTHTYTTHIDDEIHGRKEFYCPEGNLQLVRLYEYGRLLGYTYLGTNNVEVSPILLENETGPIISYYPNGKIAREMEYKNGKNINVYKSYYITGQVKNETPYVDGYYHGTLREYYPNGNVKEELPYLYDNLHGLVKKYWENGNIREEITYLNHRKEGDARYYDENGKLIRTEKYFDGEIYEIE
ncbi:MAG: tetratricopeptide repeat protein [Flavobacteriaceae bacterium]